MRENRETYKRELNLLRNDHLFTFGNLKTGKYFKEYQKIRYTSNRPYTLYCIKVKGHFYPFYVGISVNFKSRVKAHSSKKGVKNTNVLKEEIVQLLKKKDQLEFVVLMENIPNREEAWYWEMKYQAYYFVKGAWNCNADKNDVSASFIRGEKERKETCFNIYDSRYFEKDYFLESVFTIDFSKKAELLEILYQKIEFHNLVENTGSYTIPYMASLVSEFGDFVAKKDIVSLEMYHSVFEEAKDYFELHKKWDSLLEELKAELLAWYKALSPEKVSKKELNFTRKKYVAFQYLFKHPESLFSIEELVACTFFDDVIWAMERLINDLKKGDEESIKDSVKMFNDFKKNLLSSKTKPFKLREITAKELGDVFMEYHHRTIRTTMYSREFNNYFRRV